MFLAQENAATPRAVNDTAILVAMVGGMAGITAVVVGLVLYLDRKRTGAMPASVQA